MTQPSTAVAVIEPQAPRILRPIAEQTGIATTQWEFLFQPEEKDNRNQ